MSGAKEGNVVERRKKPKDGTNAPHQKRTVLRGKTFDGVEFDVPKTTPPWNLKPWTWGLEDYVAWSSLVYLIFPLVRVPGWVSIALFIFWRLCYNLGIGLALHTQSTKHSLVEWYKTKLDPDPVKRPKVYYWTKKLLSAPRGPDYDFDKAPAALNTWFIFRLVTDMILGHDLGTYILVLLTHWEWPTQLTAFDVFLYIVGVLFVLFAIWAKHDAYRVIKDYAWYWGDFFFTVQQQLNFDRVFALSPHPMYTLGYSFMYGFALLSRSYTVLYVGLLGHMSQLIFLHFVENPHIDKVYGGIRGADDDHPADAVARERGYLGGDLIAFSNFNPYRSSDLFFVVIVAQTLACYFWGLTLTQWAVVIVLWRLVHTVGVGLVLYEQSSNDAVVRAFAAQGWSRPDAFDSFKKIYNLTTSMQWICFITAALSVYPTECWSYSINLCITKHVVAGGLLALNLWSVLSQIEVLGEFAWFYGDFFINDDTVPLKLTYQGIYRFLNNPDAITGFAGFYGLALLAESTTLFALAAFGQVAAYLFVIVIEKPHMRRKYGDSVRSDSGAAIALRQIIKDETPEAVKASIKRVVSHPLILKAKEFVEKLE